MLTLAAAGCFAGDDPEKRRVALIEFTRALDLDPQPGDGVVRYGDTKSKFDARYYTATGSLEGTRESAVAKVESAFAHEGWDVFESGPVAHFLGWCVRARRDSMVAASHVGWSLRPESNIYLRLPDRVFVQTAVGKEGSNQAWSQPDRPRCGAG